MAFFKIQNKKERNSLFAISYFVLLLILYHSYFHNENANRNKTILKDNSFSPDFVTKNETLSTVPFVVNKNFKPNFEKWLNSFHAKNPEYQEYCVNAMKNNVAESQFSQDMWLFNNIFKSYALQNKKGFYVDSGANEWKLN